MQGEDGAVAGAVLAAAHRSNTPNRSNGSSANGNGGVKPSTPPPQATNTPSATRREPAASNRRLLATPTGDHMVVSLLFCA